jgi:hypothetical protein
MFSVMGRNTTKGIALTVAGLVLTVGLNSTLIVNAESEIVKESEITSSKISFKNKTTLKSISNELINIKTNSAIASMTSKFIVGGQAFTDFAVGNADIETPLFSKDFKKKRKEYIKSLNNIELDSTAPKQLQKIDTTLVIPEIDKSEIEISELEIIGQKSELDKIKKTENIESINTVDKRPKKSSKLVSQFKKFIDPLQVSAAYENRLPNYGETYVGQGRRAGEDYNSTRFDWNFMYWNNNNFDWGETYEHEFYLWNGNNIGRKTYLTKGTNWSPNCMPNDYKYLASNLPSAYLDTRLNQDASCDSWGDEVSYTIGSSWPKDIAKQTWYQTYWSTPVGDRSLPVFKVSAQIGYNYWTPGVPTGTWSSFQYNGGTHELIPYQTNPSFSYPNGAYKATFNR